MSLLCVAAEQVWAMGVYGHEYWVITPSPILLSEDGFRMG